MKKVVKFGGSSLANAEQFQKVGDIIRSDESRRYVVPSAPGKRFDEDIKVTDMLYGCYDAASKGEDITEKINAIKARYYEIIKGLGLSLSLEEEFKKIDEDFRAQAGIQYAASRGEFLNGKIMAAYLGYDFVDAASVIRFDKAGNLEAEETNKLLSKKLSKSQHAVIPGFYGACADGTVKTFSRGGSDVTGSLVAKAIHADIYENWTDVSGFLVTDPRIVHNPEPIEAITYRELRELSYMGATVLHEDAIFPVRKEGIPINIKNTNRPEDKGTFIVESTCKKPKFTITGIAGKKGFCSINIEKSMMNSEVGFGRKVLQVFEDQGISFEHVPSGIDTMTVYVHQDEFEEKEQQVIAGIHRAVQPDFVEMESDLALIAVVGRGMKSTRGTAGRIFSALAHANVNVKMIDQGSSELNIIIGVENRDFETALKAIYDILSRGKTPIVAGGTGLYFRILLENYNLPRVEADYELREMLDLKEKDELLEELKVLDNITYERLKDANKRRIVRALEVIKLLKKPISEMDIQKEPEFDVEWKMPVLTSRKDLYERINKRVDIMVEQGLIEETKYLLKKHGRIKNFVCTIGYQEILSYLDGEWTLEEALDKLKQHTRNYAKRQLTWFRKNPELEINI